MTATPDTNAWEFIQSRLRPGMPIRNWTVANGYIGEDFTVRELGPRSLLVELLDGKALTVAAADFLLVGGRWVDYVARRLPRHALRDASQRTKYVISILHQLGYEGEVSDGGVA